MDISQSFIYLFWMSIKAFRLEHFNYSPGQPIAPMKFNSPLVTHQWKLVPPSCPDFATMWPINNRILWEFMASIYEHILPTTCLPTNLQFKLTLQHIIEGDHSTWHFWAFTSIKKKAKKKHSGCWMVRHLMELSCLSWKVCGEQKKVRRLEKILIIHPSDVLALILEHFSLSGRNFSPYLPSLRKL